eukprot:TRINITY_DN21321_c0_g1_i5.p1 TRINITY_DN21321_c0_g1~~TRINITY_DN21321_c0_g1_i5.p1  ORF type:complete len:254 (-),score=43.23 TRINITY_DN21321_c0_g1_i5:217-978(-)
MTWFHKTGSLAEYLAVDETVAAVFSPDLLSDQEAAAMPLVGLTSLSSLVHQAGVSAGKRVLVLGGSSATGMMGLQIARAYGASRIVTTCSPRNAELVARLGATKVIDYRRDDVWRVIKESGERFDVIYDTVGAGRSTWEGASSGGLAEGGQLVTITGDVQREMDLTELFTRGYHIVSRKLWCWLWLGGAGYHMYTQPSGSHADLLELDRLVAHGQLEVVLDQQFNFEIEQVKSAFDYLMTGHASGKVVISMIR